MANLKQLKEKQESFIKTAKVTKAMELISSIKMRSAQEDALTARFYSFKVFGILKRLSGMFKANIDDVFTKEMNHQGKNIYILISPNKGLTGGMTARLFKKLEKEIEDKKIENIEFVVIGKKGYEFLTKKNYKVIKFYKDINEKTNLEIFEEVSNFVYEKYQKKEVSGIKVFYTDFINTTEQKPNSRVILPIHYETVKEILKSIKPTKGKFSDIKQIEINNKVPAYIFEPDIHTVIKALIPFVLNVTIYQTMLEGFASEHSARMIAMKNATDKAIEKSEEARKKFNKQRQANITNEISEIVSGIEAMKK